MQARRAWPVVKYLVRGQASYCDARSLTPSLAGDRHHALTVFTEYDIKSIYNNNNTLANV